MGRVQSTISDAVILASASVFCDFLGGIAFFLGFSAILVVHRAGCLRFSMDLELVNRLSEVLVLDEGDGPVLSLNKDGIEEGKKKMELCLVGKVIGPRPANKEGIEKAMNGVWKIHHRFQVEELSSKNVFRFFFGCREDPQRVYGGGPWTIDKQLICFVKPMGLGEISKMNFDFTSFWISINNVPLAFRYSGPMPKELAPTSVLEARERDEELAFKADLEENALVTVGVQSEVCMPVVGSVVPDSDFGKGRLGKVSSSEGNVGSTSGKVDMHGEGDPKLSHVIVANAKFKVSPKVGGGGKRKMELGVNSASDWHNLYPLVRVINGDLIHSDHRPVVASLENVIRNPQNDRKRCFRFETHWLKDDDCVRISWGVE
ncbi:hypothetical protein F8388_017483 [Cannabis sativa]|uniref:DUF4283 domain-containing protein n=1 Tax=Cannabis sativa TaxID=3483 RepID=A0A7J6F8X0_CANSA|nr:hypothetical protein F8388_017483 [Cannabis sativa]